MSPLVLVLIGIAGILIFGASIALLSGGSSNVDERLEEFVGGGTIALPEASPSRSRQSRGSTGERVDEALIKGRFGQKIRQRIARADMKLKAYEYILLQLACAVGGAYLIYWFFGGSQWLAPIGALVGFQLPGIYMGVMATRRLRAFDNQLSDTLNLWVNSLRSGYSVLQGMEAIATELPPPVSKEFERVVQEVRLGLNMSQALGNMLRRVPSEDVDLVVTAVNIQREVGGNLAEILDIISFTIRERVRIKGEIRTLTAQGRASGWVVGLLPVGLALILYRINPSYISELWAMDKPYILPGILPCGWLVIAVGVLMILGGVIVISKIVNIEV